MTDFHKIPMLVISFSISLGLTSLIYSAIILLKLEPSELIITITFCVLSLIPFIIKYFTGTIQNNLIFVKNEKKNYNLIEILCLVWISSFFLFSILYVYPQIVENPGFDIVRHYAISSVIDEHADLLRSPYPWFHLSLGALNDITDTEMWLFQTAVSFASIVLIFTFYCLSKAYLYKFNKYFHLLSTIIFTCFSGLGWIFYYHNISYPMSLEGHSSLFSIAYIASYFDIGVGQGQWLWLWYRPITIDFVLTLLLLYLMRIQKLGSLSYIFLTSLVMITLSLVHFPGLLLFAIILLSLAIFVPKIELRSKDTAISLIISIPISALILLSYTITFGHEKFQFNALHMAVVLAIPIMSLFLLRYSKRKWLSFRWPSNRIISIALLIYGILLTYWLTNMDTIKDDLYEILAFPGVLYSVPLSIFPELLGLAGLVSIPIMIILIKNNGKNSLVIFPIIFILMLIIGRIISYVVVNFQILDYWERRLVPYLWITVSVLSSIAIFRIVNYINNFRSGVIKFVVIKRMITVSFIFLLVIGGTLSTFLTLDFQTVKTSVNKISENEQRLLSELKELDPHSTLLTVTPRSKGLAEYQYFNYNIGYYRDQIWPSTSPELPMNVLNGLNSTAVIYLNNQDIAEIIKQGYGNGFLASHVLEHAPVINKNPNIGKIIQIPRLAPPTSSINTVLVIPNEISPSQYFAYDVLSLGHYNFTTALLSDIPTLKKAKTLVAPNEEIADAIIESKNVLDLNFNNLIILNLDGYGLIGKIDGEYLDPLLNHMNIIQYDNKNVNIYSNIITYSRLYDDVIDISKYDIMIIEWVGQGKNETHIIEFSSDSNGSVQYKFKDSWKGSKQLILPMNLTENNLELNKLSVQRDADNNFSWSNVTRISIITGDQSLDINHSIDFDDIFFVTASESDHIKSTVKNDVVKINSMNVLSSIYPLSYEIRDAFSNDVPFILRNQEDKYDIHYINMFPFIMNLNNNKSSSSEMYSLYGKILERLEIDLPTFNTIEKSPSDLIKGRIAAFQNVALTGDVILESTSLTIDTNTHKSLINEDGKEFYLENLMQIIPLYVDKIQVKSNSSIISGHYGFYANSFSPNKTLANFIGNPAILSILSEDGEESLIYGGNITVELDNADILSRQPKVMVSGVSNFSQFYAYGELGDKVRALGLDLEVLGESSFNIRYADKFILVDHAQLDGKYSTYWTNFFSENPDINLLKLDNLIKLETIVCILLLVLIFIFYNIYITNRNKTLVRE